MRMILKNKMTLTVSCIFSFIFLFNLISDLKSFKTEQPQCLAAFDSFGYYSYLPAAFIYDDLEFRKEWIRESQTNYCGEAPVYQYVDLENGKRVNMYHMGLAYIHLPGFLIADTYAKNSGQKRDGMSVPYHVMVKITAFFFILFGIIFLVKTLLILFSDTVSAIVLILLYAGSNIVLELYFGATGPHLYLFTLNAAFIYYTLKYYKNERFKYLIFAGIILGLSTAIRPTQAIWAIIPGMMILYNRKNFKEVILKCLIFPGLILLINIPQLLYWKVFGGNWLIVNLHSESLSLFSPYTFEFLFSYKKGWLLYSPVMIFALIGFYFAIKKDKILGRAFLIFAMLNIYILSSWECWWYAASFGSRVMIDSYVVFGVALGYFLTYISEKTWKKISVTILFIGLLILNIIQSKQYLSGYIPHESMTKDHYWYIFGRLNIDNFDNSLQEIDREDLKWPEKIKDPKSLAFKKGYKTVWKAIAKWEKIDVSGNDEFKNLKVFNLNEFPTDEVQINVNYGIGNFQAIKPVYLTLVIEEKSGSVYMYESIDINKGDSIGTVAFNLPVIRHNSDILKIYLWNPDLVSGEIKKISINAVYLKRN